MEWLERAASNLRLNVPEVYRQAVLELQQLLQREYLEQQSAQQRGQKKGGPD